MKELEKEYTYILACFHIALEGAKLEPYKKHTIWKSKPPFKYFYLNKKLFPHKNIKWWLQVLYGTFFLLGSN